MRNKLFLCLLLLSGVTRSSFCQESHFGLWYEADAQKSLNKKLDLDLSCMVRTFDNGSKIDQAFIEAGASYDLNKHIGFAVSYRIGNYLDNDYLYHIRHKWFGDIKGSLPLNRFVFSLRLRLQVLERTYFKDDLDNKAEYDGRIRIKGIYKTPKFPLNPYISYETFSHIRANSDPLINKSRSTLGLEYKINKKNIIDTEYICQRDYSPLLSILHIISVSYTFKF